MEKEYFPLWQATGDAFCNRVAERYELKQHLIAGRHTWLMAPRRYGKSSLIAQVQLELSTEQETQIKSYLIDLLPAYDRNSVQEIILNGVGRLMGMLESSPKHAIQLALKFLSKLKPE
ncbi:MAG: hypothetical protein OEX00_11675, partial [Gammaproteobacteria bacterium]|nr:hypothetical protein [Gammaproteobacteria bacterium]